MAHTVKLPSHNKTDWDQALALYREQLRFYLDYLISCKCDHQILAKVEAEVRERSVPDQFKLGFLARALVRNAIQHLRECGQSQETYSAQGSPTAEDIPSQERLVYFMRDILEYCTRDTSLLLGITDAQVEKLLAFARKRIDMTEGPSTLEVQMPKWTYFRWNFVDLFQS